MELNRIQRVDRYGRNMIFSDPGIAKQVGHQHDWNELEILAIGNRIRVVCNGTLIVDWRDPEPWRIKAGPIGLQLHSNDVPQEVQFKDIQIETFPESTELRTLMQPVAAPLGLRPSQPAVLFDGRSFTGWKGSMQ